MNSRCHRRFWRFYLLLGLLLSWASTGYTSVRGTDYSAGIQATATVISPFGLVAPDAERPSYLLYHPAKAGSVTTYADVNGKQITLFTSSTVTLLHPATIEYADRVAGNPIVLTIIYTEN